jgi:hypothetical protein
MKETVEDDLYLPITTTFAFSIIKQAPLSILARFYWAVIYFVLLTYFAGYKR